MAVYLYPRLRQGAASVFLGRRSTMTPTDWIKERSFLEREVYFVETGGVRAPTQQHELLCHDVVETARQFGFPDSGTSVTRSRFDAQCAKALYGRLRPAQTREEAPLGVSGEFLHGDFWTWIALCKLPEIVLWRFGDNAPDERFLGGFRNCFYRLWRRAWLLEGSGERRWTVLDAMTEDAFVSVVERPGLSANRQVARMIGESWLATALAIGRERMESVNRDAMKRIGALAPVLQLDGLEREHLRTLILEQYSAAAKAQGVQPATRPAAASERIAPEV